MSNGNAGRPTLAWEGDVDHINPEKFEFRAAALRYDPRRAKMLELAAGVGYLTTTVYARAYRELVLVEKDDATFRRLVRRVGRFANVHYYHKDHAAFIAEDLPDHLDFSAVDVDTYGVPGEILQAFFAALAGRRTEPFLLLLTDGGLLAVRRRGEINLYKHYLTGPDEVRPAPEGLAERFEGFHQAFLARLAGRYGFAAEAVGACRNHNQTVLYAAYVITPA